MNKFIELNWISPNREPKKITINTAYIMDYWGGCKSTIITFCNSDSIDVSESYEEVTKLIKNSK